MAQPDPIASFDTQTISYTYDNGWSFTNKFDGHTRISVVPGRGELREQVQMRELRPGLFLASWIDEEMGLLAQIIDLENGTVLAAIPVEDDTGAQIISGTISSLTAEATKPFPTKRTTPGPQAQHPILQEYSCLPQSSPATRPSPPI